MINFTTIFPPNDEYQFKYFDVEPRMIPLKPGNYRLTADELVMA